MMVRLKVWTLAALLAASAAFAEEGKPVQEPKPAQIDRNGVLILIRSTLLALDDANKTGNYSVLRDLGAPGFQLANSVNNTKVFPNPLTPVADLGALAATDEVAAKAIGGRLGFWLPEHGVNFGFSTFNTNCSGDGVGGKRDVGRLEREPLRFGLGRQ